MKGFIEFVKTQGVVGLAVGFILGGAVSKVVASLVTDIINPLIGLLLGQLSLSSYALDIASAHITWGSFVSVLIDFLVVALVVYFGVKMLHLGKEKVEKVAAKRKKK